MEITKEAIIAIDTIIGGFYFACLFTFMSQLRYIRSDSDQYLLGALKRICNLMKYPEIPPDATNAYSELVEAHKTYKQIQKITNSKLLIVSPIVVVILVFASLVLLDYSKLLSSILVVTLFFYALRIVVVLIQSWLKSGTSILRFERGGSGK